MFGRLCVVATWLWYFQFHAKDNWCKFTQSKVSKSYQTAPVMINTPCSCQSSFLQAGWRSRCMGDQEMVQTRIAAGSLSGRPQQKHHHQIHWWSRLTGSSASAPRSCGAWPRHSLYTCNKEACQKQHCFSCQSQIFGIFFSILCLVGIKCPKYTFRCLFQFRFLFKKCMQISACLIRCTPLNCQKTFDTKKCLISNQPGNFHAKMNYSVLYCLFMSLRAVFSKWLCYTRTIIEESLQLHLHTKRSSL